MLGDATLSVDFSGLVAPARAVPHYPFHTSSVQFKYLPLGADSITRIPLNHHLTLDTLHCTAANNTLGSNLQNTRAESQLALDSL